MAEKAEKKPDAAPAAAAAPAGDKKDHKEGAAKKGGLLTKMPVLLGIVMILEAIVLFAGFKFLGAGAKPAAGAELTTETTSEGAKGEGKDGDNKSASPADQKKMVVIKITEFKAPNKKSGSTILYDLKIAATTKAEFQKRVEDTITDQEPLIQDRIRTIIAESDPEKLSGGAEPGLETLRRQIKYQLDEIIGDGMIDEILVPRCIPFRTDY
jgi:flagellar basal body-associated protein FliL